MLPPFIGVAVKVMEVPTQIGPLEILEDTETDGVTEDTPVTVNTLDVTWVCVAQMAFDVSRTAKFWLRTNPEGMV